MFNKPKLCIDARMYNHSGIGKYLQLLLPIVCQQYETILLGDSKVLSSLCEVSEIIPFTAPIYSIDEQRNFKKLIPTSDLFWSPHYNIPLTRIKSKRRITTIHDVYHLAFYKDLTLKQKLYAKIVINAAVILSQKIITVSEFSKTEIIKYTNCNQEKINMIHNGVSQEAYYSSQEDVNRKYNLPEHYILFVGNVKPHKNLTTLLKAYLMLTDKLKSKFKVVIVGKRDGFLTGDEELTKWIITQHVLEKSLVFTGYVDEEDLNTVYNNASLFVFPSIYEGFGLPPLEAMLNNCPVIASSASSIPEICGNAALYFNPESKDDLYTQLNKVLVDKELRDTLIVNGSHQIKKFDWNKCANTHINIFNSILKS